MAAKSLIEDAIADAIRRYMQPQVEQFTRTMLDGEVQLVRERLQTYGVLGDITSLKDEKGDPLAVDALFGEIRKATREHAFHPPLSMATVIESGMNKEKVIACPDCGTTVTEVHPVIRDVTLDHKFNLLLTDDIRKVSLFVCLKCRCMFTIPTDAYIRIIP